MEASYHFRTDPRQLPLLGDMPPRRRPLRLRRPAPRPAAALRDPPPVLTASPSLIFTHESDHLLRLVGDDDVAAEAVLVLRQAWLDACWGDPRGHQPPPDARRQRAEWAERVEARRDAIDFWLGNIDPRPDCVDVGDGEDDCPRTLDRLCARLGVDPRPLRAEAIARLKGRSGVHLELVWRHLGCPGGDAGSPR